MIQEIINKNAILAREQSNGLRVLILCDSKYLGEDTLYALYLADGLRTGGLNPYVIHAGGPFETLLQRRELSSQAFNYLTWGPFNPFAYRKVVAEARAFQPVIVHVIGNGMTLIGEWLASALKVPYVVSLVRNPSGLSRRWSPPARVSRLILPSQAMRAEMVNSLKTPSGLCSVVEPGIDADRIAPPDEPMVGSYPTFAMAGLLSRGRGYRRFIHLAAQLSKVHPSVEFLIIGEGPDSTILRRATEKLGVNKRVSFIGSPQEWPEILRLCTASVCIEPDYGGEMEILLSMAAGCPVIASSSGVTYSYITENETGHLVGANDRDGFLDALNALMHEPLKAHKMGLAAREQVRKKYPLSGMITQISEIYESVLQRLRAGK